MKNLIFLLTILTVLATAGQLHAQKQEQESPQAKNRFWIGGSIGIENSDSQGSSELTERLISILPEFGYAFSDRWAAAIQLNFGQTNSHTTGQSSNAHKYTKKSWGLSPFVRYTPLKWKAFSVFIDGGLSFSRSKSDENINYIDGENKDSRIISQSERYGLFVKPGFSLKLSRCILLTGSMSFLNIHHEKSTYDPASSMSYTKESYLKANLNSPFNMNNFTVGFNFSF